jgi:hypothetical protein
MNEKNEKKRHQEERQRQNEQFIVTRGQIEEIINRMEQLGTAFSRDQLGQVLTQFVLMSFTSLYNQNIDLLRNILQQPSVPEKEKV